MDSEDFEKQFERFMKHIDYEMATEALFNVTRAAFMAGWLAAADRTRAPQRTAVIKKAKGKGDAAK